MSIEKLNVDRRILLKTIGAGAALSLSSCDENKPVSASVKSESATPGIIGKEGKRVLPWRNWSGNQQAQPTLRKTPKNEEQLIDLLKNSTQHIRCVGAGHSFSPLVPTSDTLISLARFRSVDNINVQTQQVDVGAGALLSGIGQPLWEAGLALSNMPDINTQTLAGAIATSTHGTGMTLGSLSSAVTTLRMVSAAGDIIECSASNNSELFYAAGNNLGALGVVTQARLQARSAYKLVEKTWVLPVDEALEQAESLRDKNRHFELYAVPHADYMLMITLNEVDITTPDKLLTKPDESMETFRTVAQWIEILPFLRSFILNRGLSFTDPSERIGKSYEIFGNLRDMRFNEMEYSIPAEYGPSCLKEILSAIKNANIDVIFPIEYRYVKADDIWLSPFYQRDSCSISCHNFHDKDYKKYFALLEPILQKYDGRPHWGKVHTLSAKEFNGRYEKFADFQRLRHSLDPKGLFLNQHLQQVLGVTS